MCNVALRQTRAGELSMWKGCAFANAARNGVFAALLAAEGMTGPAPIFEGELGFMKLVTREAFDLAPFGGSPSPRPSPPRGEDEPASFMLTRTYIKFWPAEYHSQSAIDAALQLRREIGPDRIGSVKSLDIHTFDACYDIIGKYPQAWAPRTRETADHSLPYCTAAALADGDVTLATFDPKRFSDPALLALTAKIKVHRDPSLSQALPARHPQPINGDAGRRPHAGQGGRDPARSRREPDD